MLGEQLLTTETLGYTQQDLLEGAAAYNLSQTERDDLLKKIRSVCREQGIDKTFEKHDLDVIMGPADSAFNLLVAGGGKSLFPDHYDETFGHVSSC